MASSTINPSYGPVTSTGTITSWLPLNTAWSAPAECSSLFLSDVLSPHQLYLNDPKYPNVVVGAPACLPPQISTWWYNTVSSLAPTEYSLGGYSFVCPSAYSTVFSTANSLTTTIGCCPSDYNWLSTLLPAGSVPQCNSILSPGNITFAQTNTGANNFNDGFTLATSSLSTTFTVRGVQVNGYIFSGAATTSSTSISSSFASTTTSSSFASITNGSTTSPSTDTTSPAVNKSLGLSEGGKIGVGV